MACQVRAWLLSSLSRFRWIMQYGACSVLTQSAASWGELIEWMRVKSIQHDKGPAMREHLNGQLPGRAESTYLGVIDATAQRWKPEDRMSDDASAGVALGSKHGFWHTRSCGRKELGKMSLADKQIGGVREINGRLGESSKEWRVRHNE